MKHSLEEVTKLIPSQEAFNAGPGRYTIIKKNFDVYKPFKVLDEKTIVNWDGSAQEITHFITSNPRIINLK